VRLLVLNHFSDWDIDALRRAGGGFELREVSFRSLQWEALDVLPREVGAGLEPYSRPALESFRRKFAARTVEYLEDQLVEGSFDAFVAPSDSFYYVREMPAACHRLGVPFVVVEKETTLADYTMHKFSRVVRAYAPPIADHRAMCSERQREFWTQAGGDRARMTVTGQPRFDYFALPEEWIHEVPFGPRDAPSVLFLSYMTDAYHPSADTGNPMPAWETLHRQTEEELWQLVERGWRVLVKPHPLQSFGELERRLRRDLSSIIGERVFLIPADRDVRPLLTACDAVVGFQTTALLEAMLARKPIIYTGWDDESRRLQSELIPFWEWTDAIDVAEKPQELVPLVERAAGRPIDGRAQAAREAITREQLGVVDGHAAERALSVIEGEIRRFAATRSADVRARRAVLSARSRPPLRLARRVRRASTAARRRLRLRTRVRGILHGAIRGS
jgi:hypothetical protein